MSSPQPRNPQLKALVRLQLDLAGLLAHHLVHRTHPKVMDAQLRELRVRAAHLAATPLPSHLLQAAQELVEHVASLQCELARARSGATTWDPDQLAQWDERFGQLVAPGPICAACERPVGRPGGDGHAASKTCDCPAPPLQTQVVGL